MSDVTVLVKIKNILLTCAIVEPAIRADPSGKSAKARADSSVIPDSEWSKMRPSEERRDCQRRRVALRGVTDERSINTSPLIAFPGALV